MATQKKLIQQFACQSCGASYRKWQGRCDDCGEWNTLTANLAAKQRNKTGAQQLQPQALSDISSQAAPRVASGIGELDRILGGGFVLGSVSLLGGSPGIGKSTLTMQIAQAAAAIGKRVLYVTGEESLQQIVLRAERLGEKDPNILMLAATDMEAICQCIQKEKVDLVMIDSIQVMQMPDITALPGSVTQVRYCADRFIQAIKNSQSIGLMIGHITREGNLAGPKVLEHMVDCIFYLEGEHRLGYRILRSYKNRYSATDEIGLFEMKREGLKELKTASNFFIDSETRKHPGTVIAAVEHGSRSLLVEVQALVVEAGFGSSKRSFVGVEANRANLMIATLEKNCGIKLSNKDIFINLVGGLKIVETALDLAMCVAILSSLKNQVISEQMGIVGEVGLSGEIRPIPQLKQRLIEFERLGFTQCLLPKRNQKHLDNPTSLKTVFLSHLSQIIDKFQIES